MLTLQNLISRIDEDKVNSYSSKKKTQWINEVNAYVHASILKISDPYIDLTYPESLETQLLIDTTYNSVYDFYVYAMIDMLNGEFQNYNNYLALYNKQLEEFHKYVIRNMPPREIGTLTVIQGPQGEQGIPGQASSIVVIPFPYATGFMAFGAGSLSIITKVGNHVSVNIWFKKTDGTAFGTNWVNPGVIPVGYRPSGDIAFNGGNAYTNGSGISAAGGISLNVPTTTMGSPTTSYSFSASYYV